MKRMKIFFKYFLIFLVVYFAVNLLSIQTIKSTYKNKKVDIESGYGQIDITDSKATVTNGYVRGKVTNNTDEDWKDKILKLDFFSKRGKNVGTKYINIGDLAKGESKDFESLFNIDNVDNVKANITDKVSLGDLSLLDFELDDIKFDRFPWYVYLAATILLWG